MKSRQGEGERVQTGKGANYEVFNQRALLEDIKSCYGGDV
jgi:hypothetical protein